MMRLQSSPSFGAGCPGSEAGAAGGAVVVECKTEPALPPVSALRANAGVFLVRYASPPFLAFGEGGRGESHITPHYGQPQVGGYA